MRFASRATRASLALALALSPLAPAADARQRSKGSARRAAPRPAPAKPKAAETPEAELARLREQLIEATRTVKLHLNQQLELYAAEVKRADERVIKTRELYRAGLVSRQELERDEGEAEKARAKVAGVEGQLKSADVQIAEIIVEAEAEVQLAKELAKELARAKAQARSAPRATGGLLTSAAYIRYGGARAWSISEAGSVMQFFARSFGRQLPVSSFGQSPVHDRWGYAHHNAMDVGVTPDSVEGRALMEFLRSAGIPFTAFRHAIPGTATGPHIHIGRPSHKIPPR